MPTISVNNAQLHYEIWGDGPETIVFSHGLLWSSRMFEKQIEHLKNRFRIIAFDHRGQGQSSIPTDGYDLANLTVDALELIKNLAGQAVHFVGLSMGGMVGLRLAARHPEWIRSLVLLETSADPEPAENVPRYRRLNTLVKIFTARIVVSRVMPILFGQTFLNDKSRRAERYFWEKELRKNRRKGITKAVEGVIQRRGIADELPKINCPTLLLASDENRACPPVESEKIHGLIRGSRLIHINGAGHSSSVEQPAVVCAAMDAFLESVLATKSQPGGLVKQLVLPQKLARRKPVAA